MTSQENQINTRELVLDILLAVTRDEQFAHLVITSVLDKHGYLDKRDRSFIKRVSHGTLERMPELDYVLNQFSTVKVNKMKPVIRCILRSALYQILYMDSVPNSAATNEAVKLAEKRGFRTLKGFVNGVLRNIGRNLNEIKYPDKSDFEAYMEVKYSIPGWMTNLWKESFSEEEIEGIGASFLMEGPTCIRVQCNKISTKELAARLREQDIVVEEHPTYEDVLYISEYDMLSRISEFQEGLFYIQDISSMEVNHVLQPKAGEVGIDVCAAPGGKAVHAASLVGETGHIYARDLTPAKVALIEENCRRIGLSQITPQCHDALILDEEMVGKADFVIADLPCSGLGIIGKKPDIKYNTSYEKVNELSALQSEILDVVSQYVRPGGRMVFSTCTMNRIENEGNTEAFLKRHKEFSMVTEKQLLAKDARQDGFYYALLKKGE